MVRVKKAQKQSTALLERNEPQQLVPDEQLFFVDVRGHESKSILKLKKGHVPEISTKQKDYELDHVVPVSKKMLAKRKKMEELIQKLGTDDKEATNYEEEKPVLTYKNSRPVVKENNMVRDVWAEEIKDYNPIDEAGRPQYEPSIVPRKFKHNRVANAIHVAPGIGSLPITDALSYHPREEVHQAAMNEAADVYQKELDEDRKLHIAHRSHLARPIAHRTLLVEVVEDKEENEAEEDVVGDSLDVATPHVNYGRITTVEKNKRERKRLEKEAKEKKLKNKKLLQQVDQLDEMLEEVRTIKEPKVKGHSLNKPKLGRLKYSNPFPTVALPEELNGSIRLVKPVGSLVSEQFHNLQRRNLIETRVKNNYKRRYKLKLVASKN